MNVLAVIEAQTNARNSARLDRWRSDVVNEGDSVQVAIVDASQTVQQVNQIIVASQPDHVQKFGKVAIPRVMWGIDGHGSRDGADDCVDETASIDAWGFNPATGGFDGLNGVSGVWPADAVRSVARVYFDDMVNICPDPYAAMDAWLDRNHAYRTGAFEYDNRACKNNYLGYLDPQLDAQLIADLADAIGGADRVINTNFVNPADDYHWFNVNAGKTFLCGALFDGGISQGGDDGGIGEFNTGSEDDFASGKVQICMLLLFCSWAWQWDVWPLMRAALVGGSQFLVYDPWGMVSLSGWDEQTPAAKVVQKAHKQWSQMLNTGIGDGTLRRRFPLVSASDFAVVQAQMAALVSANLVTRMGAVESAVQSLQTNGTGGNGGGGTTSLLAGANVTASSTMAGFSAQSVVNGSHTQYGGGFAWAPVNGSPGWLQFDLPSPVSASKVILYTGQDQYQPQVEPSDTMTFSKYGITAWRFEGWDGSAWKLLASVSGNNLVKRTASFASFTGSRFRLTPTASPDGALRVVQVELYAS